ncbi:MAG: VCBS repeat-containing protein [Gemmatimonadales bacterium]|nr:MAG: VCBS repeat-containing protein [Gemmatimonadales bacterium]
MSPGRGGEGLRSRDGRSGKGRRHLRALAMLVPIMALAACGVGGAGAGPGMGVEAEAGPAFLPSDSFERVIAPFEVVGRSGVPYEFPFLGGFEVPRPHLVDINGNGLHDLFVQTFRDELVHFENVGTAAEPRFQWRSSRFQELDVGGWVRFFDLDGDGRVDLFVELPNSLIQYVPNTGTPEEPLFQMPGLPVRDTEGQRIFADAQNIPFLVDLDANGRPDLFLGRIDGTLTRYEFVEMDDEGPVFRQVTDRFANIEIYGAYTDPPSGQGIPLVGHERPSLHGANSMAFADITGNGVPDLVWGDFFEPGLLLIENVGTREAPDLDVPPVLLPAEPTVVTSGFNAPALADLTGDGRLDLLIGVLGGAYNANSTSANNLVFYRGTEEGGFRLETTRFLNGIDWGSEAVPAVGDLTGNGLPDLVVGSKLDPATSRPPPLHWYANVGTPGAPRLEYRGQISEAAHLNGAPVLADLTGDGRLDLVVGSFNRGVFLYGNEGGVDEPRFVPVGDGPIARPPRGNYFSPAVGDLTGNGLPDLVVGEGSGRLTLFVNVGTVGAPDLELVPDALAGVEVGARSAPTLVDATGDGLLDLVVGARDGRVMVFQNLGPGPDGLPRFREDGTALGGRFARLAAPRLVDLTGNGLLDLLVGSQDGGVTFYRNLR